MDSDKCAALLTVLEQGNIRGAANELGYTPSGLSRMMASLEREVGFTLLVRSRQGVAPTASCKKMLPYFKRLADVGDAAVKAAENIVGLVGETVRIGTAYVEAYGSLTSSIAEFTRLHPGVSVNLLEENSSPLAQMLSDGLLDFAILSKREGDFTWTKLIDDELVALVPLNHELAGSKVYPLKRFETDPFIEIIPNGISDNSIVFEQLGITPNIRFSVSDDHAGYEMAAAGLGVTLTNALHLRSWHGDVAVLKVEPALGFSIGVGTLPAEVASPAARAFAEFALPPLTL